jgi:hypothetical protein
MDFILPVIFVSVFILAIIYFKFFNTDGISRKLIVITFILKLIAGFSVWLLYSYYYEPDTADLFKYYKGGVAVWEATEGNFTDYLRVITGFQGDMGHLHEVYSKTGHWTRMYDYGLFNDNRTMIRFHALLCLISFGNIYIHIIVMAFLSFLGAFALYKALTKISDANKYALYFAALFIPSCLFWTSGMLKEGLAMFSLGFMFYYFVKFRQDFKISDLFAFAIFAALLFISKIYILPAMAPALIFFFISKNMRKKHQLYTFFGVIIFYIAFIFLSKFIISYDIPATIAGKQNDFINYTSLAEDKGSTIEIERLKPTAGSFIKNIPNALINTFFRPFPTEINSALILLAFLENLFIILTFVLMILYFKKINSGRLHLILFALMFSLVMFSLVGLSTPNIGAIVRYKIPVLPFLLAAVFGLTDFERIKKRFFEKKH